MEVVQKYRWQIPLVMLVAIFLLSFRSNAGGVPPIPHMFYGSLTINGEAAPIGTEVKAVGNGVKTGIKGNPIFTISEGKYGETSDPLIVQGDVAVNTPIRFYVNGVDTGRSYLFRFQGEYLTRLDLSALIPLRGDANGDGTINALDLTRIERAIVQMDTETPGCDANRDGKVNALDITETERVIAGLSKQEEE